MAALDLLGDLVMTQALFLKSVSEQFDLGAGDTAFVPQPMASWYICLSLEGISLGLSSLQAELEADPVLIGPARSRIWGWLGLLAVDGINASTLPLGEALHKEIVLRSARALLLDFQGRILMGRQQAPSHPCFDSYQLGVSAHCGAGEDPVHCALRALQEESASVEVMDFSARLQAERKYVFALHNEHVRREHTTFVCVYLPMTFRWKRFYTSLSWGFDKPAAVALKLQEPLAISIVMGKPFAGSLNGADQFTANANI
eukprot:s1201_g15.t1